MGLGLDAINSSVEKKANVSFFDTYTLQIAKEQLLSAKGYGHQIIYHRKTRYILMIHNPHANYTYEFFAL